MPRRFLRKRLWATLLPAMAAASLATLSASPAAHNRTLPSTTGSMPQPRSEAGAAREGDALVLSSTQGEHLGRVINNTQALYVVSVIPTGVSHNGRHEFRVVVKNVSDKAVVEYIFLRPDDSALRTSGATSGWSLLPGETDAVSLSLAEAESVTLSAALLDDGTGEGDARQVARIKDYRIGVHEQYKRAEPILRQALHASPVSKAAETWEELQRQLASLPAPPAGGDMSAEKAAGLYDAKRFIELQLRPARNEQGGGDALETAHAKAGGLLKRIEKALAGLQQSNSAAEPPQGRR